MILKSAELSSEELEQINRFTRRELTAGELYTFNVVLCDNEVDRDYESFTVAALQKLGELFLGKTGIFDHDPKGANQSARIYDANTVTDQSKTTQYGEPYTYLLAKAYMVRSSQNESLILDIDAGIKKEVSVGCSVAEMRCSVCGADRRHIACEHSGGEIYDGRLCFTILDKPTDAYEWSFVAVPAQKNAGVIKQYHQSGKGKKGNGTSNRSADTLIKLFQAEGAGVVLSKQETETLSAYIGGLRQKAELGETYLDALRKRIRQKELVHYPAVSAGVITAVVEKMSVQELLAFDKALPCQPELQLSCEQAAQAQSNYTDFKIERKGETI